MKAITWLHALMFLGSLLIAFPAVTQHKPATIVFTNAQIADGTGAALRNGSLRVCGEFRVRQRRVTDTSRGSETATDTHSG